MKNNLSFWIIQIPGWLFLLYLIIAQGISAFSYELGVEMGTQEPAATITEVGTAFFYGFAFADLVFYIPLLGLALFAHMKNWSCCKLLLAASFAITIYWPIVCLAAIVDVQGADGWLFADQRVYWIVLPLIALWGMLGFSILLKQSMTKGS